MTSTAAETKVTHWTQKISLSRRTGTKSKTFSGTEEASVKLRDPLGPDYEADFVRSSLDDEMLLMAGVCTVCGRRRSDLYWGCVGCFENEEKRLQDRANEAAQIGRQKIRSRLAEKALGAAWRLEDWLADLRNKRWVWMWSNEYKNMKRAKLHERLRKKAREEYKKRRSHDWSHSSQASALESGNQLDGAGQHSYVTIQAQARERLCLNLRRREVRCGPCWTPDHSHRSRFDGGLARDGQLQYDRWCIPCKEERENTLIDRVERKQRKKEGRVANKPSKPGHRRRTSGSQSLVGLANLFVQASSSDWSLEARNGASSTASLP